MNWFDCERTDFLKLSAFWLQILQYPNYEPKSSHIEGSIGGEFGLHNIEATTIKADFIILERVNEKQLVCFMFDFALS